MVYETIATNAITGEVTVVPWTEEQIENYKKQQIEIERSLIPKVISPRQVRIALLQRGLLSEVESMISQQDEATRIAWEYASEFRREDPLLNNLAASLGLTDSKIDEFFIFAANI